MREEHSRLHLRNVQATLQADFQQFLVTSARKHLHTPPVSLLALDRLGARHHERAHLRIDAAAPRHARRLAQVG